MKRTSGRAGGPLPLRNHFAFFPSPPIGPSILSPQSEICSSWVACSAGYSPTRMCRRLCHALSSLNFYLKPRIKDSSGHCGITATEVRVCDYSTLSSMPRSLAGLGRASTRSDLFPPLSYRSPSLKSGCSTPLLGNGTD